LHAVDTIEAGAGLCEEAAVTVLAKEAPAEIEKLIEAGAEFDRVDGHVALGREGAHQRARVLHAHGDATGREIVRALSARVRNLPNITVASFAFVENLIVNDGVVTGVRFIREDRRYEAIARATLIASGGAGQVYRETTNPPVATGDGFALGYRAGARLRDMEFVQFHPTGLRIPGVPPFLISEAVRGEGAYLIDAAGARFVNELAPRDVVARAIYARVSQGGDVYLDLRHLPADLAPDRFPHIYSFCLSHGIDITRQPVPVTPAAHYFMGGLYTDLYGRTSMQGLFAAGEAASVGVHGANRLASNSLLECVVFGRRAAQAMISDSVRPSGKSQPERPFLPTPSDAAASRRLISETAWQHGGIIRSGSSLTQGLAILEEHRASWSSVAAPSVAQIESANMLTVAVLVMKSAIRRLESRGAHYRTDYPATNDESFRFHSWTQAAEEARIGPPPR
jgi:L-aspartate oxidase